MDATYKEEQLPNPRSNANIFEIITFSWIFKLINKGLKKDLHLSDVYRILNDDSSATLGKKLKTLWINELMYANTKNQKPNFLKVLFKMYGTKVILYGIYVTVIEIILSIWISTLVGQIVLNFDTNTSISKKSTGIYSAIGLIALLFIKVILFSTFDMAITHIGMKLKVAVSDLIYNKTLQLNANFLSQISTGQIINLMSNDVNRFDKTLLYIPFLWIGPLETIVATLFLWQEVGVSSLVGVATLFIFIPLQVWLGSKTSEIRLQTANRTDERVHLMNEIIAGIHVIKMYAWELFFNNSIKHARKKEINKIVISTYIKGILSSFSLFNTRLALFVNLFVYVLLGSYISASKVFIITTYYNMIRLTLTSSFPPAISLFAELLVSIQRIEDFLLLDDVGIRKIKSLQTKIGHQNVNNNKTTTNNKNIRQESYDFSISFENVTAKWRNTQTVNSLENINLNIIPGQLVIIIGPVGSGKSTLIQTILRELSLSEGTVSVKGKVSYAAQEPWLFYGSVRQNILFGSQMDNERYQQVIRVCALTTDLKQLPYGDKTIVGDKGISLSGGQRARINLARAVYKQADIYLLDDPLSAVDTHVSKHLFEKCIKEYLEEKTCILVTHQIQHIINEDQIILMKNAKILSKGSYQKLKSSAIDFNTFLGSITESTDSLNNEIILNRVKCIQQESVLSETFPIKDSITSNVEPVELHETLSTGNVSVRVYKSYIFSGGNYCKILCLLFVCVLTQVLASGGDYWITFWISLENRVFQQIDPLLPNDNFKTTESSDANTPMILSRQACVNIFALLTLLIIISALAESALLVSVCTTASMNLHNDMFNSITRATMHFLNTNPSGRIINRFSKDIGIIDEMMPSIFIEVIQFGLSVIGILIVVGIVEPYLILPTVIVIIVFLVIRKIYMTTTRNIKRLEGITRSPIFTHINTSLQGLTTIRAFKMEQILFQEFASHQDLHSSTWYLYIVLSRAFGFWLNIVCILYTSFVTFAFILIGNNAYGGNVGLAITQTIGLLGIFQWVMRQSTELENQMTSVERVLEYIDIPHEANLESTLEDGPPKEWPNNGRIIFKNFYMKYDSDTAFVLKNLNIVIEPTEKIGIVGRTGAGKSSIIEALFRLAINEGNIIIDNIEIHKLGLHDLRSKLSIIPQESVVFTGTLRKNLDPFDEYPDHILWKALCEVELRAFAENLPDGLNHNISEGGSNFSVGQKQLICLARAIIRNNKILVLDEATANVDPQTDASIQNIIRKRFLNCTVLTIAHRLNTIMDSDKVLVMDEGTAVEFDHPYNLLTNKNGLFYKMVEKTGPTTADLLHNVAEENYKTMKIK